MGTPNLPPHLDFTAFRWHLDDGPRLDDPELPELDDIDPHDTSNPLAVPLVESLRANRRLLDRLCGAAELVRVMLAFIRTQELEINRLESQRRAWQNDRRPA